jgi:hypothetical protein
LTGGVAAGGVGVDCDALAASIVIARVNERADFRRGRSCAESTARTQCAERQAVSAPVQVIMFERQEPRSNENVKATFRTSTEQLLPVLWIFPDLWAGRSR